MSADCRAVIVDEIRRGGPVTVARFMELALYHPAHGYYARAARRSGRDGDFFTSVDVGRVFGELLAVQLGEMWRVLATDGSAVCDLVEAGAGNGQLAADVLDTAATRDPDFYDSISLCLVERSPAARAAQPGVLGTHGPKLTSSRSALPDRIDGILYANELLDAMPTHVVVMRDRLREVYVDWDDHELVEREDVPSTCELEAYLERLSVALQPGWRAEINLQAADWVEDAAGRLDRGFLVLIDYGHHAQELYASPHSAGTLTTFRRHVTGTGYARDETCVWLEDPGSVDMTSHVDLTTVQRRAEAAGLETLAVLDQTYFLLGLGLADRLAQHGGDGVAALKARLALKTLMMPGGLGSVQKVMIFAKGVGRPRLRGCGDKVRVT
ncbi:MAG: SAM-dependent methyltransferase [Acidobacteria bacterium]|nr:SAM-dependent methyltransferase [Acidobacteriota bacterium]